MDCHTSSDTFNIPPEKDNTLGCVSDEFMQTRWQRQVRSLRIWQGEPSEVPYALLAKGRMISEIRMKSCWHFIETIDCTRIVCVSTVIYAQERNHVMSCCLCFLEPAWQTSNPPSSAVTASIKSIQHSVCKLRKSRRSWASSDIHATQALSDTLISWIFESSQVPFALQAKHASTRQWMTDASRACRSRKLTRHQQRCSSPLWRQVAPCGSRKESLGGSFALTCLTSLSKYWSHTHEALHNTVSGAETS